MGRNGETEKGLTMTKKEVAAAITDIYNKANELEGLLKEAFELSKSISYRLEELPEEALDFDKEEE